MIPLSGLGALPALVAALLVATDKRIVRRLRTANATTAERAVRFEPPRPLGPIRLRRMVNAGAVGASGGRYFLDENGYAAWRRARRTRAVVVVSLLIVVGGVLAAFGAFR